LFSICFAGIFVYHCVKPFDKEITMNVTTQLPSPVIIVPEEPQNNVVVMTPPIQTRIARDINQQLVALIESVGAHGEANQARDYANTILDRELRAGGGDESVPVTNVKVSDWISNNLPVPVNNFDDLCGSE
jgi:hypothetical protein